jgi:hypothetical protein
MAAAQPQTRDVKQEGAEEAMKLLFVEMGVGYDQHGQDITSAAVRACKDAISSNSIPAFRRGNPIAYLILTAISPNTSPIMSLIPN